MSNCIDMVTEHKVFELNDQVFSIEFTGAIPGPPGPPGPAGGSSVTWTAGENLSAGRVVIIEGGEAFYFQPGNVAHQGRAYGITTTAATIGNSATIQILGEITNAAFTFAADSILYVFTNGIIVDSEPNIDIIQLAGISSGGNKMRIDFSISILKT